MKDIKSLILRRRRQLVVHSYGYYRLNENIIPDHLFDLWSKELVELQRDYPKEAAEVDMAKDFETFDGSTGYDLPTELPWVAGTWQQLKREHSRRNK